MGGLTAAQEVLLAAAKLAGEGRADFSEWDLSVEAWRLDRNRFGCQGYQALYPDHKRVTAELMGRGRSVVARGWLEKTRTNHYTITPLGLAEAHRLKDEPRPEHRRDVPLYDALARFAFHRSFEAHLARPDEPRTWLGAAAFLALSRSDPELLDRRLTTIRKAIEEAQEWLRETGGTALCRGDSSRPLTPQRLESLGAFVEVLEKRFARQFQAIRDRGRPRGAPSGSGLCR